MMNYKKFIERWMITWSVDETYKNVTWYKVLTVYCGRSGRTIAHSAIHGHTNHDGEIRQALTDFRFWAKCYSGGVPKGNTAMYEWSMANQIRVWLNNAQAYEELKGLTFDE